MSRHPNYLGDLLMALCVLGCAALTSQRLVPAQRHRRFAVDTLLRRASALRRLADPAGLLHGPARPSPDARRRGVQEEVSGVAVADTDLRRYGADWDRYCKLVPSRIVPGVY